MMSEEFEKKTLHFLGWEETEDGWVHPNFYPTPRSKPELDSPESTWWLLDWFIQQGIQVRFYIKKGLENNLVRHLEATLDSKKWRVQDYTPQHSNKALTSLILKVIRFPEGMKHFNRQYSVDLVPQVKDLGSLYKEQYAWRLDINERIRKVRDHLRDYSAQFLSETQREKKERNKQKWKEEQARREAERRLKKPKGQK